MPRPTKDFALAFKKEIEKLDIRLLREIEKRQKLELAYITLTGDDESFHQKPWDRIEELPPANGHGLGQEIKRLTRRKPRIEKKKKPR